MSANQGGESQDQSQTQIQKKSPLDDKEVQEAAEFFKKAAESGKGMEEMVGEYVTTKNQQDDKEKAQGAGAGDGTTPDTI